MLAIQKHNKNAWGRVLLFYSFGMPSSLFINHNPTEIITAYLYGCFIILEIKKEPKALLFIQFELFSDFREVFKSTYKVVKCMTFSLSYHDTVLTN